MNELTHIRRSDDGTPEITRELIEFHICRGRQLRSQAMQDSLRHTWRWLTRSLSGRRQHARTARHAH